MKKIKDLKYYLDFLDGLMEVLKKRIDNNLKNLQIIKNDELERKKLKDNTSNLFQLLGWQNFLRFATGLTEEERIEKLKEYKNLFLNL